jgi:hypothetical protein
MTYLTGRGVCTKGETLFIPRGWVLSGERRAFACAICTRSLYLVQHGGIKQTKMRWVSPCAWLSCCRGLAAGTGDDKASRLLMLAADSQHFSHGGQSTHAIIAIPRIRSGMREYYVVG